MMIDKTFDPAAIEARWYAHWEESGAFRPARPDAEPFTIVMPPPNVTGSLHIGHALDNTLQDILVRHARLKGRDALWVVGTDHAGIATQMVVERQLALQQQQRTDFLRDEFVAKVWDWKAESGGQITRQLRRLGASCDWSREQFTMDPHFSRAVTHVFVELHRRGLLYRDKRLVNWDPAFGTAISDLEVETREVQGKFWHFRYRLADGSGAISVATTRPETMLADMAVAVHPEDERYRALVGKTLRLPITGREIPIIADEHADPALGSGAVKITPGHDFNDFEVGVRAGIVPAAMLNMLDAKAAVAQTADGLIPADLIGLDRFAARDCVVALIEAEGALERVEDRVIQVPHGDRSGAVIEPWLTDQWYVDAKMLAGPALEAVRSGSIRMVPETWKKTFYNWLENIQPWCVSRQLWWGHRIPAWYGPVRDAYGHDGYAPLEAKPGWPLQESTRVLRPFVAETEAEALRLAQSYYGQEIEVQIGDSVEVSPSRVTLKRDVDVLDTWFSSALWPFATLGWPGEGKPPRYGEGDHAEHGGGGSPRSTPQVDSPLHRSASGPPPRAGEELLRKHYPNDVLISGFDILFFWDARMIMQGLEFMRDPPFRTLYLHGLVRAPDGSKMSKSKGNTVDPLGLIDRFGADALRFTLAAMESQGRDIKLDERRVEGYRNFATKLWNAARFAQANGIGGSATLEPPRADLPVNRWIIGETIRTVQALDLALADLRFDEAANTIYHFVWDRFCDWYLELIKGVLGGAPPADRGEVPSDAASVVMPDLVRHPPRGSSEGSGKADGWTPEQVRGDGESAPNPSQRQGPDEVTETRCVAGWVLDQILVMLHPFMPFVTEELWHALATREHDLILARWPMPDARAIDPEASADIIWLIDLVSEIRRVRNEVNVPPGAKTELWLEAPQGVENLKVVTVVPETTIRRLQRLGKPLARLGRCTVLQVLNTGQAFDLESGRIIDRTSHTADVNGAASLVVQGDSYLLPLKDVIDLEAERARLTKAIDAATKERNSLADRLNNRSFVERAKPEAVEKARADHAERAAEAERLRAALARLG